MTLAQGFIRKLDSFTLEDLEATAKSICRLFTHRLRDRLRVGGVLTSSDSKKMFRLRLIEEFGNGCEICGSVIQLEFAYIARTTGPGPVSRYFNSTYRRLQDVRSHPQAYALLCHVHHVLLDKTTKIQGGNPRRVLRFMRRFYRQESVGVSPPQILIKLGKSLDRVFSKENGG